MRRPAASRRWTNNQPRHWSGTEVELQSLGREMASVRLMGRLKGTLPVRMRQAQSAPVRTISASEPQHCCVGEPPPLVLPVTKLRHGVNVVISDAVHDVAICCPDAGAAPSSSSSKSTAAAAGGCSVLSRRLIIRHAAARPLKSGANCRHCTLVVCIYWAVFEVVDEDWVKLVARN